MIKRLKNIIIFILLFKLVNVFLPFPEMNFSFFTNELNIPSIPLKGLTILPYPLNYS